MSGVINVVIGLVFIAGGLTEKLALLGTGSPKALAAVGVLPLSMGIYQLYRKYKRRNL